MSAIKLALVILVVLVIVLAAAGVIYVKNTPNSTEFILDKNELHEKTHDVLEKARKGSSKSLERIGKALDKAGEELKKPSDAGTQPNTDPAKKPERQPQPDDLHSPPSNE